MYKFKYRSLCLPPYNYQGFDKHQANLHYRQQWHRLAFFIASNSPKSPTSVLQPIISSSVVTEKREDTWSHSWTHSPAGDHKKWQLKLASPTSPQCLCHEGSTSWLSGVSLWYHNLVPTSQCQWWRIILSYVRTIIQVDSPTVLSPSA